MYNFRRNGKKVDLNMVMTKQCQHLNAEKCQRLLNLLRKFEDLYIGTLVKWTTTPLDLELKDDTKPMCLRPYPLLLVHEEIFRKEVEILVRRGS